MEATLDIHAGDRAALRTDPVARPPAQVEAAQRFEAYMLKLLLDQMRKTVGEGGLLKSSRGSTYESMMDDALATRAAERGAFGLAEQMLRQWEARDAGARR